MGQDVRSTLTQEAESRVGSVLRDKWRLDALLGVGGMASVYAATHRNGMRAAIKLLHPEMCSQPAFVARFLREGYVANKLGHPAGVRVLDDDGTVWGSVFLVMELLQGDSLDRFTRRKGQRLPIKQVLRIANDVLDLLATAHAKGILHRDIKPANIFLTVDQQVKVLDFGIARLVEGTMDGSATQTGTAMGTPSFMPPEQARGRWNMVDARTDLWALGATLYALFSGDRPRRAETVQEELLLAMTTPLISLAHLAPGVPKAVVDFVDHAVAFEMDARFPDARTMQDALREVVERGQLDGPSRAPPPRPDDGSRLKDAPSNPSGPRPDSAPVIMGPRVSGTDPTQLASGRTMGGGETAPPRRRRSVVVALLLTLLLGSALVGANVWYRMRANAVAESAQAAPPSLPPPATEATTEPTEPAAPAADTAPAAPNTGETAATPPPAVAAQPRGTGASTTQRSGSSRRAGAGAKPPSSATAEPAPSNPFDQRF